MKQNILKDCQRDSNAGGVSHYQSVYQLLESNWSNEPVEGQVNRLKTIKRQMYGRTGFEPIRKRVIITTKR
jgi:transposase